MKEAFSRKSISLSILVKTNSRDNPDVDAKHKNRYFLSLHIFIQDSDRSARLPCPWNDSHNE